MRKYDGGGCINVDSCQIHMNEFLILSDVFESRYDPAPIAREAHRRQDSSGFYDRPLGPSVYASRLAGHLRRASTVQHT